MLSQAIQFAVRLHCGQVDKAGKPYILHPLRVMLSFEDEKEMTAAVLHDVVEDCGVTVTEIFRQFGEDVASAVDAVSRRGGEAYFDFIRRCASHQLGRKIKRADIIDNLLPSRMRPEFSSLSKRYKKALQILE